MWSRTYLLLLLWISTSIMYRVSARHISGGADAIYCFGDSLSDTGNLARMSPVGSLFLSFPYGITIHEATGRPSDGLLMIDYFALKLGLPLVLPYQEKNATAASFAHGVNFAVSGATALDASFFRRNNVSNPFTNNSLGVQLDWFRAYKNSLCSSKKECAATFKRSVFFLGEIGANDFNTGFGSSKTIEEMNTTYTPLMVRRIVSAAKELIKSGAAHLVIPGNIPFGCSPVILTGVAAVKDPKAYDGNGCFVPFNRLIENFNGQLEKAVRRLGKQHPSIKIKYADFYGAFMRLLNTADRRHGFSKSCLNRSCCGVGGAYNFDLKRLCGTPEATVCLSPSKCLFWDGIHLSQEAYKIMATDLLTHIF